MFSTSTLVLLKRFITPTTIMLSVIFILSGVVWYQHTTIKSHEVTITNNNKTISDLRYDNNKNQISIASVEKSNNNLTEKILEQNRKIERITVNYNDAVNEHKQRLTSLNKKYNADIKRIMGTKVPEIVDFNCTRDSSKAIDAIQAMEFLMMEEQK